MEIGRDTGVRRRSEYRLALDVASPTNRPAFEAVPLDEGLRDPLASMFLRSYRGTIDDEGEDLDDARSAVDHYLAEAVRAHSFVVVDDDDIAAMVCVVVVGDVHYVDPIVVAPPHKRRGLGRAAVQCVLASLAASGVREVGATITDGNVPSERLFTGLGFRRVASWP
jgi:GNAT superfamily N-acetyltransferase